MSTDEQDRADGKTGSREDLQRLIHHTETLQQGVMELHDRWPAAPEELSPQDLPETPELSTRVRTDLRCLLTDAIEPALRGLRAIASYLTAIP
jgi:hypothetical protein